MYARGDAGLAPNGCMIVYINDIIVSGEAILSTENSGTPLGELTHALPQKAVAAPSPRSPPALDLRPFGLASNENSL